VLVGNRICKPRFNACRDLLVYCASVWCNQGAKLKADFLPDYPRSRKLAIAPGPPY
jgi:hypothetical protein